MNKPSTAARRVEFAAVLAHLALPDPSVDFETWMDARVPPAEIVECLGALAKQQKVYDWAPTDVLHKFALKIRARPGAVAIDVMRVYQPWVADTKQGIAAVLDWMTRAKLRKAPSVADARLLLGDALIVLPMWVERWNRKAEMQKLLTVAQYAEKHGIPARTISRRCKRGELPAELFGKTWMILPEERATSSLCETQVCDAPQK